MARLRPGAPALTLVIVLAGAGAASAQTCLHGSSETPEQKSRRDAAIQLAVRINMAQGMAMPFVPDARRYRRLDELSNLPATPQGFVLQFHTDGDTYSLSIKDRLDPCRYAVFSDQDKYVYESVARTAPLLVPLETH